VLAYQTITNKQLEKETCWLTFDYIQGAAVSKVYSYICCCFSFDTAANISCDRDFDAFDLRKRIPAVVSKLYKAINRNGGVAYIHCTAGLGRAPAVAVCM